MNVRQLKKILSNCNDDAIVYIGNPVYCRSDYQKAHENYGARYVVSTNEEVWFETYSQEDIEMELEAIVEVAIDTSLSDNDVIDILFSQDEHGYTIEDIRKADEDLYKFCINNEYYRECYQ